MHHHELQAVLAASPDTSLRFLLPGGDFIPQHFHITEVGHVRKDFIDCGGTVRSSATCLLQAWVAHDLDHRLDSTRLGQILRLAEPLFGCAPLPVEIEYEGELVSQFSLTAAEVTSEGIVFYLASKHTDCLAKESCGVDEPCSSSADSCC